jgi:hypothetical protein
MFLFQNNCFTDFHFCFNTIALRTCDFVVIVSKQLFYRLPLLLQNNCFTDCVIISKQTYVAVSKHTLIVLELYLNYFKTSE